MMSPRDIYPSVYLQPEKTVELLIWWLNPLEKPPQKLLALGFEGKKHDHFLNSLNKLGFITHNIQVEDYKILESRVDSKFNLIFVFEWSLAKITEKAEKIKKLFFQLHEHILKSSSYLILEIRFETEHDIDFLEKLLLEAGFGSITVLVPSLTKADKEKTNPFTGVDFSFQNNCWISALSKETDDDPAEWMLEFFE